MGIRRNYTSLTEAERKQFVAALHALKASGFIDQFAKMHERHFAHGIHRSSHFLPWHREMLLRFEQELQRVQPDLSLPYWDASQDRSPQDPLWHENFLGGFNQRWGLRRSLAADMLASAEEIESNQRRSSYSAFWVELENPIHTRTHRWVGGAMATAAAPADPVFYLYHAWLDMLWARWQNARPKAAFQRSALGAGLNDPMMEWPYRTPADVLDHHKLGYSYDTENRSEDHGKVLDGQL